MDKVYEAIGVLKQTYQFIKNYYSLLLWLVVALIFGILPALPDFVIPAAGVVVFAAAVVDEFRVSRGLVGSQLPAKVASILVFGSAAIITIVTAILLT